MIDVLVVGSVNVDYSVEAPRLPVTGETLAAGGLITGTGGKGANQALAAARLGARVAFAGVTGADSNGAMARGALVGAGVDISGVVEDDQTATGLALIIRLPGGDNAILVSPGANARLSAAEVEAAVQRHAPRCVLAQCEIPLAAVEAAAAAARQAGAMFLLNPAPAVALPDTLLDAADVLIPNRTELSQLADEASSEATGLEKAAAALRARGVKQLVVTDGANGAYLSVGGIFTHLPPHQVTVVDSTGAGDAFCGALAAGLAAGRSLEVAVEFANAAGAVATTYPGAQGEELNLEAVQSLLRHA